MQAATLLLDERDKTTQTNLPDYLFSYRKNYLRNRKVPENSGNDSRYNRCNVYHNAMLIKKRYRPVGETTDEIQSRFNVSCPMFITFISITTASAFHVLSARRKKNFHAAIISRLDRTNVKHGRICQNPSTDRQRSLIIHKSLSTSRDEMSIIHFHEKNFASYAETVDSRRSSRHYCALICRKDRIVRRR